MNTIIKQFLITWSIQGSLVSSLFWKALLLFTFRVTNGFRLLLEQIFLYPNSSQKFYLLIFTDDGILSSHRFDVQHLTKICFFVTNSIQQTSLQTMITITFWDITWKFQSCTIFTIWRTTNSITHITTANYIAFSRLTG